MCGKTPVGFFALRNGQRLIVPGHVSVSRLLTIVSGALKEMQAAAVHRLEHREIASLKAGILAGVDWLEK